MKSKRCLVTGGSGFIGSALVRRLVRDGYAVRVLDNDLRGSRGRLKEISRSIESIQADIRDTGAVRRACKGMDTVYHLAYLNGTEFFYKRPDLVLDIGVKGMINVVDSCVTERIRELVLLSSSEVYQKPPHIPTVENVPLSVPDPLNSRYSYGGGKIISELMALNYGRRYLDRVIIVRPHNVYGPDMGYEHVIPQFIMRMRKICARSKSETVRFPIQGTGEETRAFTFIDDFIDAFMLVMAKGGHLGIYNIGTMDEIPVKDVALKVGACFGKKVAIIKGAGPKGGVIRRCPDTGKIRKMGFRPKVSFDEGLEITARWYCMTKDKGPLITKRNIEDEEIRPFRV